MPGGSTSGHRADPESGGESSVAALDALRIRRYCSQTRRTAEDPIPSGQMDPSPPSQEPTKVEDKKPLERQIGLFAGLFSAADGGWIRMPQLRRISATGAWMVFYGFIAYGAVKTKLDLCGLLGLSALGVVSYLLFLGIGGLVFPGEQETKKADPGRES